MVRMSTSSNYQNQFFFDDKNPQRMKKRIKVITYKPQYKYKVIKHSQTIHGILILQEQTHWCRFLSSNAALQCFYYIDKQTSIDPCKKTDIDRHSQKMMENGLEFQNREHMEKYFLLFVSVLKNILHSKSMHNVGHPLCKLGPLSFNQNCSWFLSEFLNLLQKKGIFF